MKNKIKGIYPLPYKENTYDIMHIYLKSIYDERINQRVTLNGVASGIRLREYFSNYSNLDPRECP